MEEQRKLTCAAQLKANGAGGVPRAAANCFPTNLKGPDCGLNAFNDPGASASELDIFAKFWCCVRGGRGKKQH